MIAAAHLAVEGEAYPVDIGSFCGDRNFVYIAAFGAFTEVSYLTPQDKKNVLGHQAYMLESVKSLTSIKSYRMRVESEEITLEGEFIFGMVTNTISVGGFKGLVTQNVALNDGEFEVLLIRTPRTPLDLSNIVNYMFLKEEPNEYVHKFRTKALTVLIPCTDHLALCILNGNAPIFRQASAAHLENAAANSVRQHRTDTGISFSAVYSGAL